MAEEPIWWDSKGSSTSFRWHKSRTSVANLQADWAMSLARYVIADAANPAYTAATQWFERTLDDSANKRVSVPEAFLAVDAILNIYENVASDLPFENRSGRTQGLFLQSPGLEQYGDPVLCTYYDLP